MSFAMKMALQRLPIAAKSGSSALLTSSKAGSHPAVLTTTTARTFSSASAALDDEGEITRLQGERSPITEFFDLAVNHGHTALGPPPKYQVREAVILACGVSEDDLKFNTVSYPKLQYPPYVQHGEHEVKMIVNWDVLPLNEFEKRILQEIVGRRYNPERNELKMTSNQFGSRIENKRHLTSMLDRLVFAARKLAATAADAAPADESEVKAED